MARYGRLIALTLSLATGALAIPYLCGWWMGAIAIPFLYRLPETIGPKQKAALILFGVPKQFRFVWKSYLNNIVSRNRHVHFEVYMHMYSDLHKNPVNKNPFTNPRNGEHNAALESPDDIQEIFEMEKTPVVLTTSSQSTFDATNLSWLKGSDLESFGAGLKLQSVKNMFGQGNSLKSAFLCFLKQTNHTDKMDMFVFARSDTFMMDPLDIPRKQILDKKDIWVPSWQSWGGINDRFALTGRDAAKVYAFRINGYKKAVLNHRNSTLALSEKIGSEIMNENWMLENKLNITEMGEEWAKLLHVRVDGHIELTD